MEIGIVVGSIVLCVLVWLYFKDVLRYETKETEVTGIVQTCKKGALRSNQYYKNLAIQSQMKQDYAMYSFYMMKANNEGHYEYCVTVEVAGTQCVVIRDKRHEPGSEIKVIEKKTYQDGEWIETTYK